MVEISDYYSLLGYFKQYLVAAVHAPLVYPVNNAREVWKATQKCGTMALLQNQHPSANGGTDFGGRF